MFLCSRLSMNLTVEENAGVTDMLEDQDPTSDMTPSKSGRMETVTVYRWMCVDETGKELKKSFDTFLDKDTCLRQGEQSGLEEKSVLQLKRREVSLPTAEELVQTVYSYMLEREFNCRIKQRCFGCIHDKGSRTDHMGGGCLEEKEILAGTHARPCHLRISIPRLWEAVNRLKDYFKIDRVEYRLVVLCLKQSQPKETLLKDEDFFYFEYQLLDEL